MSKCDNCRYQLEKGKCNSFMIMAMTMAITSPTLPGYREITEEGEEFLTKLDYCMGYEQK